MEALRGLYCEGSRYVLNLIEHFIAATRKDALQDPSNGPKVLIDLVNLRCLALFSSLVGYNLRLFLAALPDHDPVSLSIGCLLLMIEHQIRFLMKLAAVPAVPYLAHFNHQVDQVLNAEHPVVGDRVLLVDSFDKQPEVIDHFRFLSVDPKVTTSQHRMEELLLKLN